MLANMSRWGVTTLRMAISDRFMVEQDAELRLGRLDEDGVLELVDLVVELSSTGKNVSTS